MSITQLAARSLSVVLLFLCLAPAAHAETLVLNQPLVYAGLTFAQPLTFSSSTTLHHKSLVYKSLVFGQQRDKKVHKTQSTLTLSLPSPKTSIEQTVLLAAIATEPTENPSPTPTDTPSPTPTPKALHTPTPKPQSKLQSIPSPSPSSLPSATPTPTSAPVSTALSTPGGLNADKLFGMVNSYRASKGLSQLQKDDRSCQLAASRAPEVNNEVATNTMHQGLRNRNLPYWNTENIISYNSEEGALSWWINDQIHKEALEGQYTYSCIACSGNSCAEEFTNYQAK